jgi:ATP phosphoribosyltransferase regulatory subunit
VQSLRRAGVRRVVIDLGHTGIVRALLAGSQPAAENEPILAALAAKDVPGLQAAAAALAPAATDALLALTRLHGGTDIIDAARRQLPRTDAVTRALDDLAWLADRCRADEVSVDLSDLHGYRYYTGANFAAYDAEGTDALVRGGRYDDIGRAFGRARPATGFSTDLRDLVRTDGTGGTAAILAPGDEDPALARRIDDLRAGGECVVRALGADLPAPGTFDRELRRIDGQWRVVPIDRT